MIHHRGYWWNLAATGALLACGSLAMGQWDDGDDWDVEQGQDMEGAEDDWDDWDDDDWDEGDWDDDWDDDDWDDDWEDWGADDGWDDAAVGVGEIVIGVIDIEQVVDDYREAREADDSLEDLNLNPGGDQIIPANLREQLQTHANQLAQEQGLSMVVLEPLYEDQAAGIEIQDLTLHIVRRLTGEENAADFDEDAFDAADWDDDDWDADDWDDDDWDNDDWDADEDFDDLDW